ncbi:TlpA disulfide reductase family protein [Rhodopirellula sp. JC639]|uniref:TlpA disulfide reductase family protein n=1 Tax=Stieleria mannarensis TaxID=2755585 RepID=UPI0015FEF448|nr:TlpA disulfide reductase family protein [Rhodopirellula sp. JC639]
MRFFVVWVQLFASLAILSAEQPQTLTVGDRAPALEIEQWIHSNDEELQPVREFENGKVYIIEFWGTWCPPCIAMMPHLADTQLHYGYDKLRLVSISTETRKEIEAFLERTVPGSDKTYGQLTSVYSIATDPDQRVYRNYMEASSSVGVPMAFLVGKTGLIEWSGNPQAMDQPLKQVIDGTWNREEFMRSFRRNQQLMAEVRRLSMLRQKHGTEPQLVLNEIEKAIERFASDDKDMTQILGTLRIRALMESGRNADAESEIRKLLSANEFHRISSAASILVQMAPNKNIDVQSLAGLAARRLETAPYPESLRGMPALMTQMAQAQKRAMLVRLLVLAGDDRKAIAVATAAVKEAPNAQAKQMAEAMLQQLHSKPAG